MSNRYFRTDNFPKDNQVVCIVAVVKSGTEGSGESDPERLAAQQVSTLGVNIPIREIEESEALALIVHGVKEGSSSALVPSLVEIYIIPAGQ